MRSLSGILSGALLLGVNAISPLQCDMHYRSADYTVLYNNVGTVKHNTVARGIFSLLPQEIVTARHLGLGHVVTVSGKRFSAADTFLEDREGNSLELCTQRDPWGGVFSVNNLDYLDVESDIAETTWFVDSTDVEGEDLLLLAMAERLRNANRYHRDRLNMQIIVTERAPLLSGEKCGEEVSVNAVLEEAAKGSHFFFIVALSVGAELAWVEICAQGLVCDIVTIPDDMGLPNFGIEISRRLNSFRDSVDLGACDCFTEDAVDIRMSWIYPTVTISEGFNNLVTEWLDSVVDLARDASDSFLSGGSIENEAGFRVTSYGGVNLQSDDAACDQVNRIARENISRGVLDETWDDVAQDMTRLARPVVNENVFDKAALESVNGGHLRFQERGQLQVISIFVDTAPYLESGDCSEGANIALTRLFLSVRPRVPAYFVFYVYGTESVLTSWRDFCSEELSDRCLVIDLVEDDASLATERYTALLMEIRSKFACEAEAQATLPPISPPRSTEPVTLPPVTTDTTTVMVTTTEDEPIEFLGKRQVEADTFTTTVGRGDMQIVDGVQENVDAVAFTTTVGRGDMQIVDGVQENVDAVAFTTTVGRGDMQIVDGVQENVDADALATFTRRGDVRIVDGVQILGQENVDAVAFTTTLGLGFDDAPIPIEGF